jgi:hypothetical protein
MLLEIKRACLVLIDGNTSLSGQIVHSWSSSLVSLSVRYSVAIKLVKYCLDNPNMIIATTLPWHHVAVSHIQHQSARTLAREQIFWES